MMLFYIANARIPTEKAHGVAIMRMCAAFAKAGVHTVLIVPRRILRKGTDDPFLHYRISPTFRLVRLPVLDLLFLGGPFVRVFFWLETVTFYISAALYLLFQSRTALVYTRDYLSPLFRVLGFSVVYECHHISKRTTLFFLLQRNAAKIITISRALKEKYLTQGFSENKLLVAPSGVDLSTFATDLSKNEARAKLDLPLHANLLTYTGNFTTMGKDKGLFDSILALRELPEDALLIAAGGSSEDIAQFSAHAKEQGVLSRVLFFGTMSQEKLAQFNSAADVLLMPFPDTPHYRNHMSPLKMFEYMAAKRPVIASDLPTIREVLSEESAVLVPPGNPLKLAQAVLELRKNPEKGEELAQKAFAHVHHYSWDARARNILSFLSS